MNAKDIIGVQQAGDYILDPTTHAQAYSKTAPELSALLASSTVRTIAEQYQRSDREALAAQVTYKSWMHRGNLAILLTAVLGAMAMALEILRGSVSTPIVPSLEGLGRAIGFALPIASGLAGATAVYSLYILREGRLFEKWMGARARAEMHRLDYFTCLIEDERVRSSPQLLQLVLEYFRRYQLDVQLDYFDASAARHERSAGRTIKLAGLAVAAAAVASLGGAAGGAWTALSALTVAGAALSAYAGARELMNQDRSNAERYARTRDALEGMQMRLDEVRSASRAGNFAAVSEFVAAIHEQISLEHREWLESSEGTKAALGKLDEALSRTRSAEGRD